MDQPITHRTHQVTIVRKQCNLQSHLNIDECQENVLFLIPTPLHASLSGAVHSSNKCIQ